MLDIDLAIILSSVCQGFNPKFVPPIGVGGSLHVYTTFLSLPAQGFELASVKSIFRNLATLVITINKIVFALLIRVLVSSGRNSVLPEWIHLSQLSCDLRHSKGHSPLRSRSGR